MKRMIRCSPNIESIKQSKKQQTVDETGINGIPRAERIARAIKDGYIVPQSIG